jgi:hypothetical protein
MKTKKEQKETKVAQLFCFSFFPLKANYVDNVKRVRTNFIGKNMTFEFLCVWKRVTISSAFVFGSLSIIEEPLLLNLVLFAVFH